MERDARAEVELMANGVSLIKCQTWEAFISEVKKSEEKTSGDRIYRGHASSEWKLSSIFERWPLSTVTRLLSSDPPDILASYRERFLKRFKDLAIGLPGLESRYLSEVDWLALGRHHGLITPLLDWTKSPYIAAFFAFADYENRLSPGWEKLTELILGPPVAVWALNGTPDLKREGEFDIVRPTIGYSQHSQWMRAQQSIFTRLTHHEYVDLESYLVSLGLGHHLERYEIPGQEMREALTDLRRMNISFASLYPDLHGAGREANILVKLDVLRGSEGGGGGSREHAEATASI